MANGSTRAQVVLECRELDATLDYFTKTLGFRVDRISPADYPREIDISGHGLELLLLRSDVDRGGTIRVEVDAHSDFGSGASRLLAPNGTTIEVVRPVATLDVPPVEQSLVISRLSESIGFASGRAGMGYRDLIPGRQGGRFIASHIRIDSAGEVGDYVHFHKIRFQMIFCYKGWVRVVYEDQGEPILLEAGDSFLQPPEIRHRVLESSAGLEVVEVGCPADHDTYADHDIALPTGVIDTDRDFGGQRFVHNVAANADWEPWRFGGWECRDVGFGVATAGLAGARVAHFRSESIAPPVTHAGEFMFMFVLDGDVGFELSGGYELLSPGDSIVVPAGHEHVVRPATPEASILEVTLPADLPLSP